MFAYSTMSRAWRDTLDATRVRPLRPYDMRHIFASLLITAGKNLLYVSRQMGHHSPAFTLTVYGHLIESLPRQQVEWIDELVFPEGFEAALNLHLSVQFGSGRAALRTLEKSGFCSGVQLAAIRYMAGGGGFEPPLTGPEPVVLPLDDPPAGCDHNYTTRLRSGYRAPSLWGTVSCARREARSRRPSTRSLPSTSISSKRPGPTVFPVRATRTGWITSLLSTPSAAAVSRTAFSIPRTSNGSTPANASRRRPSIAAVACPWNCLCTACGS